MYNRFLSAFLRLLELSLQIVLFLSLSIILGYTGWKYDNVNFYRCFLIVIPVIFTYFGRVFINSYFLSIVLHGGLLVLVTTYAWSNVQMLIVTTFLLVVYSIRVKFGPIRFRDENIPVPMMVIMIIGYIIAKRLDSRLLADSALVLFFVFLALQVLHNGINKLNHVIEDNSENATFQVKQITIVHIFLLIISITLIVGAMMLFFQIPLQGVAEKIWLSLLFVLKFIMKIFTRGGGQSNKNEVMTIETTEEDSEEFETQENLDLSNDHADLLNTLFVIFAIIIIIVILVTAVVYIYKYSRIFRNKTKEGQDKVEFLKPAFLKLNIKKENVTINAEETESVINRKIRKIYRTRVKKAYKKQSIPECLQPSELTQTILSEKGNSDSGNSEKITDIYEKARYSEESVSQEQLDFMEKNINS